MPRRLTPTRWIGPALVVTLVFAATVVIRSVPSGDPPERFAAEETSPDDALELVVRVDSLDAAKGILRMRIEARPGPALPPPEGALVLTDIGSVPTIRVTGDSPPTVAAVEIDVSKGDVSNYPFDAYTAGFLATAVAGADRTLVEAADQPVLPFSVTGLSNVSGFSLDGSASEGASGVGAVAFTAERDPNARTWATAMMAINWLLAAGAVAVALSVILSQRAWESRYLAWLGSMLFALSAFRNTAPGGPPIGTFPDFYAFFPAVTLVMLSLTSLIVTFLVRPRDQLGL